MKFNLHIILRLVLFSLVITTTCVVDARISEGVIHAKSIWLILISGLLLLYVSAPGSINIRVHRQFRVNAIDMCFLLLSVSFMVINCLHAATFCIEETTNGVAIIVCYFFIKRTFKQPALLPQYALILFLMLACANIVVAVLQWLGYYPSYNSFFRITGFFFNPGPYAIFLASLSCIAFSCIIYAKEQWMKLTGAFVFVCALPEIIIIASRAAWIGIFAGILFLLLLLPHEKLWHKRRTFRLSVCVIALFVFTLSCKLLFNFKKESAEGRILIWTISEKIVSSHAFLGVGQYHFPSEFLKNQALFFREHPNRMYTDGRHAGQVAYVFNDIFQFAVMFGLPGVLLFIVLLWQIIKAGNKIIHKQRSANTPLQYGAMAALVTIVAAGAVSYPLQVLPIRLFFFTLVAIISSVSELEAGPPQQNTIYSIINGNAATIIIKAVLSVTGCVMIAWAALSYVAYHKELLVEEDILTDYHVNALKKYNAILKNDRWYITIESNYLVRDGNYGEAIAYLESVKMNDSDYKLLLLLGSLYQAKGEDKLAEQYFDLVYFALPGLLAPKVLLEKLYLKTNQMNEYRAIQQEINTFGLKNAR